MKDKIMTESMRGLVRQFELLAKELQKTEQSKQYITIYEFLNYEPLFNKSKLQEYDPEELRELSNDFFQRIDPFNSIKVIDENQNILFELPPIFFPLSPISSQNKTDVNKFHNLHKSQIPKFQEEGMLVYLKSLAESQLDQRKKDIISQYKQKVKECYNTLKSKLKNGSINIDNTEQEDEGVIDDSGLEWE